MLTLQPSAGHGQRLAVEAERPLVGMSLGASVAVDGVCLTMVQLDDAGARFAADLGPETLACTTLGSLRPGDRVHLERPLRLGDPLGGHLVAGHVDGVGTIVARVDHGDALEMEMTAPPGVVPHLVLKGSIAVDGVSLTCNRVAQDRFSVTLIPHTRAVTRLADKAVGARVNLEADLIGKHVERLIAARAEAALSGPSQPSPGSGTLTIETLRRHGYVP